MVGIGAGWTRNDVHAVAQVRSDRTQVRDGGNEASTRG
jgi:hypothetical protein